MSQYLGLSHLPWGSRLCACTRTITALPPAPLGCFPHHMLSGVLWYKIPRKCVIDATHLRS